MGWYCPPSPSSAVTCRSSCRSGSPIPMRSPLMKEAGYDGRPIVLLDPTDLPYLHNATLVTAQLLRKIGVNVQVQAMDWATLLTRRAEKKPPEEGG